MRSNCHPGYHLAHYAFGGVLRISGIDVLQTAVSHLRDNRGIRQQQRGISVLADDREARAIERRSIDDVAGGVGYVNRNAHRRRVLGHDWLGDTAGNEE